MDVVQCFHIMRAPSHTRCRFNKTKLCDKRQSNGITVQIEASEPLAFDNTSLQATGYKNDDTNEPQKHHG